jgi:hypothetical protein
MGRAEKRAKEREEAKAERIALRPTRAPSKNNLAAASEDLLETADDTARRIYRAGNKPERHGKTTRRAPEKPRKWQEGRM